MIDRREKKCFLGATLLHAALVTVLLVGPGFLSSKPPALPLLDYIPDELVDAALNRGGNPGAAARPAPLAPAAAPTLPKAEVAPPPPTPPKAVKAPEPPKPLAKAESFTVPENKKSLPKKSAATETTPKKSLPKISTRSVIRDSDQIAKQQEANRKEAEKAAKDFQNTINQTTKSLMRNLSESVSVEVTTGPGGGGPSVGNWAQAVHSIYDRAWIEPADATDGRATAKATITIAKDGSVVSASLTSPSGNPALDKSVRAVLDRVRQVPAFPAGARDERRTVTIKFNLLAQHLPG